MSLTIGSLFSGMGGLDMAVEAVTGAQPAWFCEWDDAPSKVLAQHWPTVPNYRDVTTIDWEQMPRVDILTGGTPCQDLSHAGKRAGMTEGTRSNLWVNMREAIHILRPRLVVWENVLGALSAEATSDSDMEPGERLLGDNGGRHLRALGRVLGDLAEVGFDAEWTTVRASDVGAPHHRARVFLIAWPSSTDPSGTAVGEQPRSAPAEETGPRESDGPVDHRREWSARNGRDPDAADTAGIRLEARRLPRGPETEIAGHHDRQLPLPERERAHSEPERRDDDAQWGPYAVAVRRWERLTRPAPAPTVTNRNGKPQLNNAFAEWMMGLPEGHVTGVPGLTRTDMLKMIGNGVCPQQGAAALRQLLEASSTPPPASY